MELLIGVFIGVFIGLFIGIVTTATILKTTSSGTLHIVTMIQDGETYMFLDLDREVDEITAKKYATFKVTQK